MLDLLKRHEIQVLRRAGHNASEVAVLADVSRRSVRWVGAEMAKDRMIQRPRRLAGSSVARRDLRGPTGSWR
jgi:succinylarginine dihydrolase